MPYAQVDQVRRWILPAFLALFVGLGFFEDPAPAIVDALITALLIATFLGDSGENLKRRLLLVVGGIAALAIALGLTWKLAGEASAPPPTEWIKFRYVLQWIALLTVASDMPDRLPQLPGIRPIAVLLLAFTVWQFLVIADSFDPRQSARLFFREMGLYALLSLQLAILWRQGIHLLRPAFGVALVLALWQVASASALYLVSRNLPSESITQLVADGVLLKNEGDATWRLVFPMGHHNRLGFAMLVNVFLFLFAAVQKPRAKWITAALFSAAAAAFVIAILSMTRGAVGAIAGGLTVLLIARLPLWVAPLVASVAALMLALSPAHRAHIATIVDGKMWRDPASTMGLRFNGWHGASLMIRDEPATGIGYSTETFSDAYKARYQALTGDPEAKRHSHNIWLQYASESGIPAIACFLAFMGLRWWLLASALRATRGDGGLWVIAAYEFALFVFSMFFVMTKRDQGILIYALYMTGTLYAAEKLQCCLRTRGESLGRNLS